MDGEIIEFPDGHPYGLAVPFVAARSGGGPYDDAAFAAGFQVGQLHTAMAVGARLGTRSAEWVVRDSLAKQLDLIAMFHGYTSRAVPLDDGWARFSVVRSAEHRDDSE